MKCINSVAIPFDGLNDTQNNDERKRNVPNVNREELLNQLESIKPGLSPKDIIEQSSCFVFKEGNVMTYNDEVACTIKSCLKIDGAVVAEPLIAILRKLPADTLEIDVVENELIIQAKRRKSGLRMEQMILLPIDNVEKPMKWVKLPEDFTEAIEIVSQCAGTDETNFALTCVHVHPEYVEACDNYQLSRFPMKTGIKKASLVRQSSIKNIIDLGMIEFSESDTWVHFRNSGGLVLSCRRHLEEYISLDALLECDGSPTVIPKGLSDAAERADVFSSENADNNQVTVDLSPKNGGQLRITGQGASGWYKETKKLKYTGEPMRFRIAPKLLMEISKRHNECEIAADRLKIDGGKFTYVTCLGKADD